MNLVLGRSRKDFEGQRGVPCDIGTHCIAPLPLVQGPQPKPALPSHRAQVPSVKTRDLFKLVHWRTSLSVLTSGGCLLKHFLCFVFQGRLEELMESYGIRGGASLWLGAQEEKGAYTRWKTHSECSGCGVNAPGQLIRRRHCRHPCSCCRYLLPVRFRPP